MKWGEVGKNGELVGQVGEKGENFLNMGDYSRKFPATT